jgi:hypothetical protein
MALAEKEQLDKLEMTFLKGAFTSDKKVLGQDLMFGKRNCMRRKIDHALDKAEKRIGIENLFCIFYDMDEDHFRELKDKIKTRQDNDEKEREKQRD